MEKLAVSKKEKASLNIKNSRDIIHKKTNNIDNKLNKKNTNKWLNIFFKFKKTKGNKETLKNKKSKKNIQKNAKNNQFLSNFKQNWQHFLVFGILFDVFLALIFLTFLKNDYYEFLIRPKIITNQIMILLLLIFLSVISATLFFFSFSKFSKKDKIPCNKNEVAKVDERENLQNANENLSLQNIESQNQIFDKKPKIIYKSKIHNFLNNIKNKLSFKNNFEIFDISICFGICLTLSFVLKNLCLCVIFSFAQIVVSALYLKKFIKSSWAQKILCVLHLLLSICLLSVFYMLYMLN